MEYIYFDEDKRAYGVPVEGAIARIDRETWERYANREAGDGWDIIGRTFVCTISKEDIELQAQKDGRRMERNLCLEDADWRLQRAQDNGDAAAEEMVREYRRYLRNFTEMPNWWEQVVLSFEEFSEVTK